MAIVEVRLSEVGLLTMADVAKRMKCTTRAVQKWINAGTLPVVIVGHGPKRTFLVRESDLRSFTRPTRGRPPTTV